VDDLTVLEKINLLVTGLASFNCKLSVPSDLPTHNQIIQADQLKSQGYLDAIKDWTANQKMVLNKKKTKAMIVNFTENYQFATRLKIDDEALEVVDHTKLLGVIISNDFKW
jgi:predicted Zn-dependent protease